MYILDSFSQQQLLYTVVDKQLITIQLEECFNLAGVPPSSSFGYFILQTCYAEHLPTKSIQSFLNWGHQSQSNFRGPPNDHVSTAWIVPSENRSFYILTLDCIHVTVYILVDSDK